MLAWLKKAFKWIQVNLKLVLLIIAFTTLAIFIFWLSGKNRKIRALENSLRILKAKIDVERLSIKYDTEVENLKELKEQDTEIRYELNKIEKDLKEKLKGDLTADEIIRKFKELGL